MHLLGNKKKKSIYLSESYLVNYTGILNAGCSMMMGDVGRFY